MPAELEWRDWICLRFLIFHCLLYFCSKQAATRETNCDGSHLTTILGSSAGYSCWGSWVGGNFRLRNFLRQNFHPTSRPQPVHGVNERLDLSTSCTCESTPKLVALNRSHHARAKGSKKLRLFCKCQAIPCARKVQGWCQPVVQRAVVGPCDSAVRSLEACRDAEIRGLEVA